MRLRHPRRRRAALRESRRSADAYFADGVTDEIRTKLAQVAGLEVIARGSSLEYRRDHQAPAEIARELGADYLLTGTVRWDKAAGGAGYG